MRLLILTCISVFFGAGLVFAATCSDDAEYCNETQICTVARSYSQGKFIWQTKPKYRNHVAEAKQRGLTCGVTEAVAKTKQTCATDIKECSADLICSRAVSESNGKILWNTKPYNFKHVTEAKRRRLTCGVEDANGQSDTATLDALREQLAKTKQKLAGAEQDKADLEARLNTAMWDHNKISTVKTSEHTAELATITEQYETEQTATLEKIEKLQTELSALETDASEAQAKVTELTNQLVESRANVSTSSAAKLKAEKKISQAESAALAAEQELEATKQELAEFKKTLG